MSKINLRTYLFSIFTLTVSMFTFWLYILFNFDPYEAGFNILIAFYLSMYLYVGGVFFFLIYFFKLDASNKEVVYSIVNPSLRQGYILSMVFMLSLVLKGLRLFGLFELSILIAIAIVSELYFRSKNARQLPSHN